ncbi:MAG: hypothetical protein A4E71_00569 [Smithella sp. PtaU1.Bin162]|nr:MAG: hypothetical protein A4E71_00569 [Smithella sp. PtaU1.Bin162]
MDKTDEIRRINLEISVKLSKIELQLSQAKSMTGLFETLIAGIEKEFAVPFVWLTLIENADTAPIIEAAKSSDLLKNKLNVISRGLFERLIPAGVQPVLVNRELHPYYKLFPPAHKYFVKSLALIPFRIGDEIAGSWNNGDAIPDRYRPDMDTALLQKLAQKLSLQLTKLVADLKK